jgi:soluble cytochrome b562
MIQARMNGVRLRVVQALAVGVLALLIAAPFGQGTQPSQPPPAPQPQPTQPNEVRRAPAPVEFKDLSEAMQALGRGLELLDKTVDQADKKDRHLETVAMMQRAAIAAKSNIPDWVKPGQKGGGGGGGPTPDDFRKAQIKFIGTLLELETAIIDGKADAAKALLKKLGEQGDAAHNKFAPPQPEDEKDKK